MSDTAELLESLRAQRRRLVEESAGRIEGGAKYTELASLLAQIQGAVDAVEAVLQESKVAR